MPKNPRRQIKRSWHIIVGMQGFSQVNLSRHPATRLSGRQDLIMTSGRWMDVQVDPNTDIVGCNAPWTPTQIRITWTHLKNNVTGHGDWFDISKEATFNQSVHCYNRRPDLRGIVHKLEYL